MGGCTRTRVGALAVIGLAAAGLAGLALPGEPPPAVPAGARAGDLDLQSCTYDTEAGTLPAECGTLAVPENRHDPGTALIALPVVRIPATGPEPSEPVFRLAGGPGQTNMAFPQASRLTEHHDVVLVGYRGVDGSTVLDCPEVAEALRWSGELAGGESMRRYAEAFTGCGRRLAADGVDLAGYSLPQRVDDLEAARRALGYQRIDLLSQSAGTRTAMIYSWRARESLHRSVMIGVNPPGHFLWDPQTTDAQLAGYADLCRRDRGCAARTDDLAASMRATATDVPDRWLTLPIEAGTVRAAALWGLADAGPAAAPFDAPATLDAWLSAGAGDPSGLWAVSLLADLVFPDSFVWGEFAATGAADAAAVDAYYAAGGDPGTILGGDAADFLWAGGRLVDAWPAPPDSAQYPTVRPSPVPTLLVSGSLDFSTPAGVATTELLPALPDGHQVVLDGLGHVGDFWRVQPEAGQRLLAAYLDRGEVDPSGYHAQDVRFAGPLRLSTIAWTVLGTLVGGALLAVALAAWMVARVRRRGGFGPRTGVALRLLAPLVLGIGGWFLALLVVASLWPWVFLGSPLVAVPVVGLAAGAGVRLATARRDAPDRRLPVVLGPAVLGAVLGALVAAGFAGALTALAGATLAANLVVLVGDIAREQARPPAPIGPAGRAARREPRSPR